MENPYQSPPQTSEGANQAVDSAQNTWAMAAHVSGLLVFTSIPFANIIAPLIIWQMQKDTMPHVEDQAKEALNFQITISLYLLLCIPLVFVVIGILLIPIVIIFDVVAIILAAMAAQRGEAYRYPATIRMI